MSFESEFPGYPPELARMAKGLLRKRTVNADDDLGADDEAELDEVTQRVVVRDNQKNKDDASKHRPPLATAVLSNHVDSLRPEPKSRLRLRNRPDIAPSLGSLNAMRIVLALLFRVRAKWDRQLAEFTTNSTDLSRALGLRYHMSRRQVVALLNEIASTVLTVRDGSKTFWIPAMAVAWLDDETGVISLQLNEKLKPYLLRLDTYRELYPPMLQLRSPRAVLLYMLLRKCVGRKAAKNEHRVTYQDLCRVIQARKMDWWKFEPDILEPAIKDINKTTELRVRYKPVRQGRTDRKRGKVDSVMFTVRQRKAVERPRLKLTSKEATA